MLLPLAPVQIEKFLCEVAAAAAWRLVVPLAAKLQSLTYGQ